MYELSRIHNTSLKYFYFGLDNRKCPKYLFICLHEQVCLYWVCEFSMYFFPNSLLYVITTNNTCIMCMYLQKKENINMYIYLFSRIRNHAL
jgi:hypothetical protein